MILMDEHEIQVLETLQLGEVIVTVNATDKDRVVSRIYIRKEEGQSEEGEEQMTLFEFRKGKIFKIFEYW